MAILQLPFDRVRTFAAAGLTLVGGLLTLGPLVTRGAPDARTLLWAPLAGVALAIPSFTWLCSRVRCQSCGYRLFWHAIARVKHPAGLYWFATADRCPGCGGTRAEIQSSTGRVKRGVGA
jgi:hypothetical protein